MTFTWFKPMVASRCCRCLVDAFFADDVVSGDVSVTGVDAGRDRNDAAQAIDDFGDLLEAASQGEFGASGIFDQDGESGFRQVKALGSSGDGGSGLQQSSFAIGAAERAGMEHEIVGADSQRTLDFSAKRLDGFLQELLVGAGQIHQIICMDDQRLEIVFCAESGHLLALQFAQFVGSPLARAGRENLKRVAAKAMGAFGRIVDASGGGGVDADAARSEAGRAFRRGRERISCSRDVERGIKAV